MIKEVIDYYENYDEDSRLVRDKAHLMEYLTTIRYFDRIIKTSSEILDTCAGTGRYSFYLANKGHKVTACDLAEHNVNIIKANKNAYKLNDTVVCNALDLSRFKDNSFDVVLCMGALYHLNSNSERKKAIAESTRVCRVGGVVVLAYINRVGAIIGNIKQGLENIDELLNVLNDTDDWIFKRTTPQTIEKQASECGLIKLHNIGVDGINYTHMEKINNASDENFAKLMEYHYATCEDESITGASTHGLYIGIKL